MDRQKVAAKKAQGDAFSARFASTDAGDINVVDGRLVFRAGAAAGWLYAAKGGMPVYMYSGSTLTKSGSRVVAGLDLDVDFIINDSTKATATLAVGNQGFRTGSWGDITIAHQPFGGKTRNVSVVSTSQEAVTVENTYIDWSPMANVMVLFGPMIIQQHSALVNSDSFEIWGIKESTKRN